MNRAPFARAIAMMAAISAAITAHPANFIAQRGAIDALGSYESRGKGKTRRHDRGGTAAFKRAAAKRRSVTRHREACRG